jgi:quercetin dioxygenase-like cupin family protein
LCLTGHLEFELDRKNIELSPGDNLSFNSDAFHRWINLSDSTAVAVLVIPPSTESDSSIGE